MRGPRGWPGPPSNNTGAVVPDTGTSLSPLVIGLLLDDNHCAMNNNADSSARRPTPELVVNPLSVLNVDPSFSTSRLEGSSTSVGRHGYCHSPVLAIKNVDVCEPILLDIPSDVVYVSSCWSSAGSHNFYLHVQHCSCHMAIISSSYTSISVYFLLHQMCCYRLIRCVSFMIQ